MKVGWKLKSYSDTSKKKNLQDTVSVDQTISRLVRVASEVLTGLGFVRAQGEIIEAWSKKLVKQETLEIVAPMTFFISLKTSPNQSSQIFGLAEVQIISNFLAIPAFASNTYLYSHCYQTQISKAVFPTSSRISTVSVIS